MKTRLGIFVTHPVQYMAPVWVRLSCYDDLAVKVFYFSDQGVSKHPDPGFGKAFAWDVPLLEGYCHEFLSREPITRQHAFRIPNPHRLFQQEAFDCVLVHGYTQRFARQLIHHARRCSYKLILRGEFTDMPHGKGIWRQQLGELYRRWFYRHVDRFCYIGIEAREHLEKRGVLPDRLVFAPYCVDDQYLVRQRNKINRQDARRALNINDNQVVFLFSGKMLPRKQPLLLGEAALKLSGDQRMSLICLGDGQQLPALRKMLEPAMGTRAVMPGFVNQSKLGRYFCAADVFVLPSQFDTWGLVVNEAMHFGLPCIVSDRVGCRRDLVEPGVTGEVFPFDNSESLAQAMGRFLADPLRAARMGPAILSRINDFTVDRAADGIATAARSAMS